MSSELVSIQRRIAGVVAALDVCSDIPVVSWRPRVKIVEGQPVTETSPMISSAIDLALQGTTKRAGKCGVAIIVLMPIVTVPNAEAPGPDCEIITNLRIRERTLFNMGASGTLKPAEDVAWELQRHLHEYSLGGSIGQLYCEGRSIAPVLDPTDTSGDVIYNVEVQARVSAKVPARTAPVAIGGTAAAVTLTCATSGASLYFTTNGNFPGPGEPGSTLYSGAFAVDPGTAVLACAFSTGAAPSHLTEKTISS